MTENDIYDYLRDNLSVTIEEEYDYGSENKKIVVCLRLKPPNSEVGFNEATIISKDYIIA